MSRIRPFAIVMIAAGCGRALAPREGPPPITVSVCAAAKSAPGARVRVHGEFDGFGYATNSLDVTVATTDLCNERGAGLVFARLSGKEEAGKLSNRRPRGKREPRPGDPVEIDGFVTKVEDGRFTYLRDSVVVR